MPNPQNDYFLRWAAVLTGHEKEYRQPAGYRSRKRVSGWNNATEFLIEYGAALAKGLNPTVELEMAADILAKFDERN